MRYNPKERIGVNAVEEIILKDFNWIFRNQPIADMGMDALIEEVIEGNPTGKFIAIQIKSGLGNFSTSSKKLTYYISNIHYHYWLNFNIPILLICHIPEYDKTLWIELSEENIKPTKKRWKIEIPKKNELNLKSKSIISKLLINKDEGYSYIKIFNNENINNETIYDIVEKIKCINDANEATIRTVKLLEELSKKINSTTEKFVNYNKNGISINSGKYLASIKTLSKDINLYSKRFENETQIFSETFAEGFMAYERGIIIKFLLENDSKFASNALITIGKIPSSFEQAITGFSFMRKSISELPNDFKNLKEAKKNLIQTTEMVLNEYETGKLLVTNLIDKVNVIIQN
jgi:hypothetical protein